ncbi:MAG: hypothetical protein M3Y80_10565 [Verrucomicrobiota bacterium]|nr:hypothetical protein [Verrucomicrobiota bacterium]
METPASHPWFLRKHDDGSIFGPLTFEHLVHWASSAQIAPHDYVSADQENWMKAPMLPELGMDWIVEVTTERLYGPTTLGAIREFLRLGEIDEETFVINSCDATRQQIRDLQPLLESLSTGDAEPSAAEETSSPASAGMSIAVQERIRELEQALREERRALAELETRYRDLDERHQQLVNAATAPGLAGPR